jgi:hypothetical protein
MQYSGIRSGKKSNEFVVYNYGIVPTLIEMDLLNFSLFELISKNALYSYFLIIENSAHDLSGIFT